RVERMLEFRQDIHHQMRSFGRFLAASASVPPMPGITAVRSLQSCGSRPKLRIWRWRSWRNSSMRSTRLLMRNSSSASTAGWSACSNFAVLRIATEAAHLVMDVLAEFEHALHPAVDAEDDFRPARSELPPPARSACLDQYRLPLGYSG